jgi:hypothetical protein
MSSSLREQLVDQMTLEGLSECTNVLVQRELEFSIN